MPQPPGPVARALVLLSALALPALAAAQDPPQAPGRRATPIRDSLERVVARVVLAHLEPCEAASRNGVPCFPVGIDEEGPRFSVAEAMRRYRGTGSPAPGVPTVAEIQGQMSGAMQSASGGVSIDPVCTAKGLWKKMRGKGTTYHLYRTWDQRGERPLLADHELDPEDFRANPEFRFEYLGRFDGECAAVAAWNAALRDALGPKPDAPEPPPHEEPREPR
jgi:hypothetical protein